MIEDDAGHKTLCVHACMCACVFVNVSVWRIFMGEYRHSHAPALVPRAADSLQPWVSVLTLAIAAFARLFALKLPGILLPPLPSH